MTEHEITPVQNEVTTPPAKDNSKRFRFKLKSAKTPAVDDAAEKIAKVNGKLQLKQDPEQKDEDESVQKVNHAKTKKASKNKKQEAASETEKEPKEKGKFKIQLKIPKMHSSADDKDAKEDKTRELSPEDEATTTKKGKFRFGLKKDQTKSNELSPQKSDKKAEVVCANIAKETDNKDTPTTTGKSKFRSKLKPLKKDAVLKEKVGKKKPKKGDKTDDKMKRADQEKLADNVAVEMLNELPTDVSVQISAEGDKTAPEKRKFHFKVKMPKSNKSGSLPEQKQKSHLKKEKKSSKKAGREEPIEEKENHSTHNQSTNKHEQSKQELPNKLQSTEEVMPQTRAKVSSHPSTEAVNEAGLISSIIRYPMKLFSRQEPDRTQRERSQTPEISSLGSLEYALTDLESTEANSAIVPQLHNNVDQEHYTDLEFYDAHGSPEPQEQVSIFTMMKRIKRRSKPKDKAKTLDNRMSWPVRPTRHHSPDGGSQDSFMTPPSPVSTWVLERVARSATLGGDRRRYYDLDRNYTSRPRPWSTLDFPPPECHCVLDDHLFPNSVTPTKIPSCKSLDEKTYNVPYMDDNAFPLYEPEWPLGDSKGAIYPLLTDPNFVNCKLLARAERGSLSSYSESLQFTIFICLPHTKLT
ncbi:hypothetical protein Ciccas_013246 [Cichlidogyrus casuarinus]|uniref:Uncharacterized protein n=1 Tax=Cichlidogyrus casuarinus TaxID=1844966 RepID=A0ABD2PR64_9PLAT